MESALMMLIGSSKLAEKSRRSSWAVFGWTLFAGLSLFILYFGSWVWFYYNKIRSGEIVNLPQFSSKLTQDRQLPTASFNIVDRSAVEETDQPTLGPEQAKLTIVEFADFECPYSKESATVIRRLMTKYKESVRFVFRDYPLETIHASAPQAAVAAECAREQGKFWAYHDKLFANAPELDFNDLLRYGREVGLESRQFEHCLIENRYARAVEEDVKTGKRVGLRGTPTFFFNGQKVEGAIPEEILERIITRLAQ